MFLINLSQDCLSKKVQRKNDNLRINKRHFIPVFISYIFMFFRKHESEAGTTFDFSEFKMYQK